MQLLSLVLIGITILSFSSKKNVDVVVDATKTYYPEEMMRTNKEELAMIHSTRKRIISSTNRIFSSPILTTDEKNMKIEEKNNDNNRALDEDVSLDEVCQSYMDSFFKKFDEESQADALGTECTCTYSPQGGGFVDIKCQDECYECFQTKDGEEVCSMWSAAALANPYESPTDDAPSYLQHEAKGCFQFDDDTYDGTTFCEGYYFDDDDELVFYSELNGEKCTNWTSSYNIDDEFTVSYECSNLGYPSDILIEWNRDENDTSANYFDTPFEFLHLWVNDYDNMEPKCPPAVVCDDDQDKVTITVQTDGKGDETYWFLKQYRASTERFFNVEKSGKEKYNDNTLYKEEYCVKKDKCHKFVIKDTNKDGLCCDSGNGYWRLDLNDVKLKQRKMEGVKKQTYEWGTCP